MTLLQILIALGIVCIAETYFDEREKQIEKGNRMREEILPYISIAVEAARQYAFRRVPTEHGIFDVKARATSFAAFLAWRNLVVSIGEISEAEADRIIKAYGLKE